MNRKVFTVPLKIAIILAIITGLVYPVVVTGVGQALFPYQANGDVATVNNVTVGSYLIGQFINSSAFFHIRNESASGVDPDIIVSDALAQALIIHNATNISLSYLHGLIHNDTSYTLFFFGTPYVNVLTLNIELINAFHNKISIYNEVYSHIYKDQ
jgi:K+-transporting ATPase ATPase C chain